ncbi:unnamed protein product, partial [Penicillium glandicola]
MPEISTILAAIALSVSIGTSLLPVKEWLREWCSYLWLKPHREDASLPADFELETVLEQFRTTQPATLQDAVIRWLLETVAALQTEFDELRGSTPA